VIVFFGEVEVVEAQGRVALLLPSHLKMFKKGVKKVKEDKKECKAGKRKKGKDRVEGEGEGYR
jgi:hypothetical protein